MINLNHKPNFVLTLKSNSFSVMPNTRPGTGQQNVLNPARFYKIRSKKTKLKFNSIFLFYLIKCKLSH